MPRIRKRNITVGFHPNTFGKLSEVAEQFEITINEVIRECVENDLPRFIDRNKKRRTRRTNVLPMP